VTTARKQLTGRAQRLCRSTVITLILLCTGCTSARGVLQKLPIPDAKQQALRKQVEGDSFPTAKQAGL
jgi:hypothetical protein